METQKYEIKIIGFGEILDGAWGWTAGARGLDHEGNRVDVKMSKKLFALDLCVGDVLVGEARRSTQHTEQLVAWKNISSVKGEVRGKSIMDHEGTAYYARCFGWAKGN